MKNSLIFSDKESQINSNDFEDADVVILSISNFDNVDQFFSELIEINLKKKQYKNILIPLTFGEILSDFLGLSFATHVRVSVSKNQTSNIFIYGTESLNSLVNQKYFNLLLLQGVFLIDYNLKAIRKAIMEQDFYINSNELVMDLKKLNIEIPLSFYDNHSIANIWGMHRLLEIEDIDKDEISNLKGNELLYTIYFKWLLAKNKISDEVIKEAKEDTKEYRHKLKGLKVVNKIDLKSL